MFSLVKCEERCLLYSMRIFGSEIDSLIIASGTIFNEIVVWKMVLRSHLKILGSHAEDHVLTSDRDFFLPGPNYRDTLISRLVGHEGSIFRIAWFTDGKKLLSVSDDRREVQTQRRISCNTLLVLFYLDTMLEFGTAVYLTH